jgi:hypothetical protein
MIKKNGYFSTILEEFEENLENLPNNFSIPQNTWIYSGKEQCKDLIQFLSKNEIKTIYTAFTPRQIYEFQVILSQIDELNKVFKLKNLVDKNSYKNYIKKLKILLNTKTMPLYPEKENGISNEGRNTLFELRLLKKFIEAGYRVEIPDEQHPDFRFYTSKRQYSVECKRIFTPETFTQNIEQAIGQLMEYSIINNNTLGVVAINISRYFNINKNGKLFIAENHRLAEFKILKDYTTFARETIKNYRKINIPFRIPLILFEYYEFGLIGGKLSSVSFTDINNTQSRSKGITLYDIIKQDILALKNHFGVLLEQ